MGRGQTSADELLYGRSRIRPPVQEPEDLVEEEVFAEELGSSAHARRIAEVMKEIDEAQQALGPEPCDDPDWDWYAQEEYDEQSSALNKRWREEVLAPSTRIATQAEYEEWFEGFKKTPSYDPRSCRKRDRWDAAFEGIYVVERELITRPGFGSGSYSLIVPDGVRVEVRPPDPLPHDWEIGHGSIYWMKGYRLTGEGNIVLYPGMTP